MNIEIRELRDRLRRHLATVRPGRTVPITDDGRLMAETLPIGAPNTLERLVAEGRVALALARKRSAPKPIKAGAMVSDLIVEQRR